MKNLLFLALVPLALSACGSKPEPAPADNVVIIDNGTVDVAVPPENPKGYEQYK